MDSLLNWIGLGSVALLAVAVAVSWLEHRARVFELRRDLQTAENSRFMLEERVRGVDFRLQELNAALESQHSGLPSTREGGTPRQDSEAGPPRTAARPAPHALQALPAPPVAAAAAAAATAPEAPKGPRPPRAPISGWADTQPMVQIPDPMPSFEPTRPVDLHPL